MLNEAARRKPSPGWDRPSGISFHLGWRPRTHPDQTQAEIVTLCSLRPPMQRSRHPLEATSAVSPAVPRGTEGGRSSLSSARGPTWARRPTRPYINGLLLRVPFQRTGSRGRPWRRGVSETRRPRHQWAPRGPLFLLRSSQSYFRIIAPGSPLRSTSNRGSIPEPVLPAIGGIFVLRFRSRGSHRLTGCGGRHAR